MFTEVIQPRFSDTDALGHINNTVFAVWFESARQPVFRIFTPDLDVKKWALIIAGIQLNYHAQTHYGEPVDIRTWISEVGNRSFKVYQEAWQHGQKTVSGTATMVKFDYQQQRAALLTEPERQQLLSHLLNAGN